MTDLLGLPWAAMREAERVEENRALSERVRLIVSLFPRDRDLPWLAPEDTGGRLSDTGEEG